MKNKIIVALVSFFLGTLLCFHLGIMMLPCKFDLMPRIGSVCIINETISIGGGITYYGEFKNGKPSYGRLNYSQLREIVEKKGQNNSSEVQSYKLETTLLNSLKSSIIKMIENQTSVEVKPLNIDYDFDTNAWVMFSYFGEFSKLKPHGEGKLETIMFMGKTILSTKVLEGYWENGTLVKNSSFSD